MLLLSICSVNTGIDTFVRCDLESIASRERAESVDCVRESANLDLGSIPTLFIMIVIRDIKSSAPAIWIPKMKLPHIPNRRIRDAFSPAKSELPLLSMSIFRKTHTSRFSGILTCNG